MSTSTRFEGYINVTGCDLVTLVKKAYALSNAQGMGFLHHKAGDLTDEQAKELIRDDHPHRPVYLDYVAGRAVKFTVHREGDQLYVAPQWYDHHQHALRELLQSVGKDLPETAV